MHILAFSPAAKACITKGVRKRAGERLQDGAFLFRYNSCRVMDANPGMGDSWAGEETPTCRLGEGNKESESGSAKQKKEAKRRQGESAGAAPFHRQQTELHGHPSLSLAEGRTAVGRAGVAPAGRRRLGGGGRPRWGAAAPAEPSVGAGGREALGTRSGSSPRCSGILVCRQDS